MLDKSRLNESDLIGMRVRNTYTNAIGNIKRIQNGLVEIDFHGDIAKYAYPAAFANYLELENEDTQNSLEEVGMGASFEDFKNLFKAAINREIVYLKTTGGKRYRIIDGEKLPYRDGEFMYAFETDTDLHFPDGTAIKIWFPDKVVLAYVVSCEEFTILIRTADYIGEYVESAEFTSDQWMLLEALTERLFEMNPKQNSLAYEVAMDGKRQISSWQEIQSGQDRAFNKATSDGVTFIWGPPGTGKTETLVRIALEHVKKGRRVLMLSYSNVSVDGAVLRMAKNAGLSDGDIIRYGYPRMKNLLDNDKLVSYRFVLRDNPKMADEYKDLIEQKKNLDKKDPKRIEVNKKIIKIREFLVYKEKALINKASFVATTVSKAIVDEGIYSQRFDAVIFDEASMAYVPQIVFAAGLAQRTFVCLGDFCQLPAIVQNNSDNYLSRDIFDYTGITSAVESNLGHNWLVMLNIQYRMHNDISNFVSSLMYHGRLKTADMIVRSREEIAKCHPCSEAAMSMVDLSGMYSVCTKTMDGSRVNVLSALLCLRIAEENIDYYEVGIITPYNAQSRLIVSMLRDLQESDARWLRVTCATVHQFQGSEKPIIIYDAVDCYRMPYPGMLLTSMKNDNANRLFNVAITRAKGKFILVANVEYLVRKNISKNLIFTKAVLKIKSEKSYISGAYVLDEVMPRNGEEPRIYVEDREKSWKRYIEDIRAAKMQIKIDIPDMIAENKEAIEELVGAFSLKKALGVNIVIRTSEDIVLSKSL